MFSIYARAFRIEKPGIVPVMLTLLTSADLPCIIFGMLPAMHTRWLVNNRNLVILRHLRQKAKRYVNGVYQRRAQHQLQKRGYLGFLSQRPPNAFSPDFADLWFLYQVVRRRKPRYILEFGSGCSTAILAQALWDNSRVSSETNGYLYSVDAFAYWAEVTRNSMPSHLGGCCEVWHSPVVEVEYDGMPAFRHEKIPDVEPDLLYLDGPQLTGTRQVAVDVLDLEDRFCSGFYMIIDGRWRNTLFLREHLKRRYKFKRRRLFANSTFELLG